VPGGRKAQRVMASSRGLPGGCGTPAGLEKVGQENACLGMLERHSTNKILEMYLLARYVCTYL
jgi:hypothetical protein